MAEAGGTPSSSDDRRREAERLELLGDLKGEVMVFQPMTLRQISATGAQIDTSFPLQLNSLHDVRLSLGDDFVIVKSRVAHCRLESIDNETVSYRSGLEFVEPSDRARAAIEGFVEAVRAARRAP